MSNNENAGSSTSNDATPVQKPIDQHASSQPKGTLVKDQNNERLSQKTMQRVPLKPTITENSSENADDNMEGPDR